MKKFKGISLKRVLAITIIASVGLLSGCAGAPGAIAVQDNVNLLTYEQLSKQIENTVVMDETLLNKKARWAGKIVSVRIIRSFQSLPYLTTQAPPMVALIQTNKAADNSLPSCKAMSSRECSQKEGW